MRSRQWAAFLAFSLMLAAAPVGANQNSAKEHYKRGMARFVLERWDDAIAEFEAGFAEEQEPAFLYNIAQSNKRAGRIDVAIRYYRKYLDFSGQASDATQVEAEIARLGAQLAEAKTAAPAADAPAAAPTRPVARQRSAPTAADKLLPMAFPSAPEKPGVAVAQPPSARPAPRPTPADLAAAEKPSIAVAAPVVVAAAPPVAKPPVVAPAPALAERPPLVAAAVPAPAVKPTVAAAPPARAVAAVAVPAAKPAALAPVVETPMGPEWPPEPPMGPRLPAETQPTAPTRPLVAVAAAPAKPAITVAAPPAKPVAVAAAPAKPAVVAPPAPSWSKALVAEPPPARARGTRRALWPIVLGAVGGVVVIGAAVTAGVVASSASSVPVLGSPWAP